MSIETFNASSTSRQAAPSEKLRCDLLPIKTLAYFRHTCQVQIMDMRVAFWACKEEVKKAKEILYRRSGLTLSAWFRMQLKRLVASEEKRK